MNKKALEGLKREESILNEMKDIQSQIRDYEHELEWVSGDYDNPKYITSLVNRIDNLNKKWEELNENN
jgi:hypothetical protein